MTKAEYGGDIIFEDRYFYGFYHPDVKTYYSFGWLEFGELLK
jgi:hypothetical protein